MRKRNIIILINSLSHGGAERVASILVNRFAKDEDVNIELILLEDQRRFEIDAHIKVTVLSTLDYYDSSIKKTLYIPYLAYTLNRYIKSQNPDLIVSFLYRADFVNILAARYHDKPIIVSERVNASSTYNNPSLNAKINKFLIRKLYPKAQHIINVSEGTKEDLIKNFHIPAQKQSVVYNPYDDKSIQKLSYEPLNLPTPKEHTVVAVSSLRPIKNIAMLLRAFSQLKVKAHLIIVGDGSEEETLKMQVQSLNLQHRVSFVGAQENPYTYMRHASIYISTSQSEGFPNAMIEAMLCGCAIISTDCPSGPREILAPQNKLNHLLKEGIEYAQYGILVGIQDEDATTQALSNLLTSKTQREAYGQKAISRAKAFTLEKIYAQYKNTFFEIIDNHRP